jgi:hypothetical protein
VVGGAALLGGSFLEWIDIVIGGLTRTGFDLELPVFFNWDEVGLADSFLTSAGIVTALLGAIALVGAVTSRLVLVRAVGLIALAAAVLLWLSLANTNDMLLGYWVIVGGAVLTIAGGFIGSRRAAPA